MKIVIDVPDHLYEILTKYPSDSNEGTIENVLMKAVENGTPLEDIKAEIEEQVLESLSDGGDDWFTAEKVNECLDIIDKHIGDTEWIIDTYHFPN